MLAYVFWHRPEPGATGYEAALRAFHATLATDPPPGFRGSVAFARAPLPWFDGYEDWYLVDDWAALGTLTAGAIAGGRAAPHDRVADRAAEGAGAVYAHVSGSLDLQAMRSVTWSDAAVDGDAAWRRQLNLGPAPQFCAFRRAAGAGATPRTPL